MAGGIKLNLKGFNKMLENIQAASGDADKAAQRAITAAAKITENELRAECSASGVPSDITNEIRAETKSTGDRYEAEVGWEMDSYDPKKPSAGYKAVFLNYGTPRRTTRKGYNRGKVEGRQFVSRAKKKARPKVKKAQQTIYERVMRDLKK